MEGQSSAISRLDPSVGGYTCGSSSCTYLTYSVSGGNGGVTGGTIPCELTVLYAPGAVAAGGHGAVWQNMAIGSSGGAADQVLARWNRDVLGIAGAKTTYDSLPSSCTTGSPCATLGRQADVVWIETGNNPSPVRNLCAVANGWTPLSPSTVSPLSANGLSTTTVQCTAGYTQSGGTPTAGPTVIDYLNAMVTSDHANNQMTVMQKIHDSTNSGCANSTTCPSVQYAYHEVLTAAISYLWGSLGGHLPGDNNVLVLPFDECYMAKNCIMSSGCSTTQLWSGDDQGLNPTLACNTGFTSTYASGAYPWITNTRYDSGCTGGTCYINHGVVGQDLEHLVAPGYATWASFANTNYVSPIGFVVQSITAPPLYFSSPSAASQQPVVTCLGADGGGSAGNCWNRLWNWTVTDTTVATITGYTSNGIPSIAPAASSRTSVAHTTITATNCTAPGTGVCSTDPTRNLTIQVTVNPAPVVIPMQQMNGMSTGNGMVIAN
jgi:hypothetical protein